MKYYNLVYNYRFLADWFETNPTITRKEFLASMDFSDYNTLKKWIDGQTMMPLTQMLKFCNHYSVPISAFFLNEHGEPGDIFAPILPTSMTEPIGGWQESGRKAGMKLCDPRSEVHVISCLPEYVVQPTQKPTQALPKGLLSTGKTQVFDTNSKTPPSTSVSDGSAVATASVQGGSATAPDITHTERMRYLDIIERLSADIIRLTNEKAAHWGERSYGSHHNCLVAEDPHK